MDFLASVRSGQIPTGSAADEVIEEAGLRRLVALVSVIAQQRAAGKILPPGCCNRRRRLAQPDQRHHNSYHVNDGTEVDRTEVAHPVIVEVSHPMHW